MLPILFERVSTVSASPGHKPAAKNDRAGTPSFTDALNNASAATKKPAAKDAAAPAKTTSPADASAAKSTGKDSGKDGAAVAQSAAQPATDPSTTMTGDPNRKTVAGPVSGKPHGHGHHHPTQNVDQPATDPDPVLATDDPEDIVLELLAKGLNSLSTAYADAKGATKADAVSAQKPVDADAKDFKDTKSKDGDNAKAAVLPVTKVVDAVATLINTVVDGAAGTDAVSPANPGDGVSDATAKQASNQVDKLLQAGKTDDKTQTISIQADTGKTPALDAKADAQAPAQPGIAAPVAGAKAPAATQAEAAATDAVKSAPAQHDALPKADAATALKTADASQPSTLLQNNAIAQPAATDRTTAAAATPGATTPQAVALPVSGVGVEIASKALAGKNRFEIRLDPPELGRIHVRLDVDRNGEITSRVMADHQDTLDLLRRDASGLERALQDAGLKTANNGLQFSLRDQGFGRNDQPMPTYDTARLVVRDDTQQFPDAIPAAYRNVSGSRSGLDIRV